MPWSDGTSTFIYITTHIRIRRCDRVVSWANSHRSVPTDLNSFKHVTSSSNHSSVEIDRHIRCRHSAVNVNAQAVPNRRAAVCIFYPERGMPVGDTLSACIALRSQDQIQSLVISSRHSAHPQLYLPLPCWTSRDQDRRQRHNYNATDAHHSNSNSIGHWYQAITGSSLTRQTL